MQTIKSALVATFVKGCANHQQLGITFLTIGLPLIGALLAFGKFPRY